MTARAEAPLSSGWVQVRVSDVADSIQYGYTASAIERVKGPRLLRITDIQDGRVDWATVPSCDIPEEEIPKYQLSQGDLVFARTGATTGKSYLIGDCPNKAVFASYLIRVRVSTAASPRYLAAFFQSPDYWRQVEGGKRGIGQPNVNGKTLGEVRLPLPPLDEQRRVVAEIDKYLARFEAGVAALRRVQAKLKRYRAAVLKAACEGRLVPTEAELARRDGRAYETGEQLATRIFMKRRQRWTGQYKEATPPDLVELTVPEGWCVASIDQLSSVITSGSRDWSQFYGRGPGTFVLAKNVRPMRLDLTERQLVAAPKHDAETERTRIRLNDLLVTIVGARTGDVCRVPSALSDHFVCQSVALLRPMISSLAKFAELYLASPENGQAQWKRYIYGQGRPHLSFEQLRMTAIPIPPLAEQERISAEVERRLSVIEELEAVVTSNLQRAARLRQSILERAFSGRLVSDDGASHPGVDDSMKGDASGTTRA